ncbi:ABC transporter permease [Alloiococcus sp. CFN-8]|uniref:ABC transporter permease n=1 Tax=Alloiococcus sp. CFN-8 TaxID=3416081 RepID=UPI003CF787E2
MTKFINDIKKYYKYTIYSAKSELKSEVANSHLSWLWWILDPLLFMLVYTFVYTVVFSKQLQYVAVFVFIGLSLWSFFEKTLKNSVKLVTSNSSIVSKVYIPKYMLIFVKMGVNGFKMFISFALVILLMGYYRVPVNPLLLIYVIPIFITLFLLTFGFSTLLLHFGVFVEDLSNVINVALKMVFYFSGVFYSIQTNLPENISKLVMTYNPLALLMMDMRNVLLYSTTPHIKLILIWFLVGLVLSILGVRTIYKYENSYIKVI